MSTLRPDDTLTASWQQVEDFFARLHQCARADQSRPDFYRNLIEGCVHLLAASAGVVWQRTMHGGWQPLAAVNLNMVLPDAEGVAAHTQLLHPRSELRVVMPGDENPTDYGLVLGCVAQDTGSQSPLVIEFFLRGGASPAEQQGWQEFMHAVIGAAEAFELRDEVRALRSERAGNAEVLALVKRIHRGKTLKQVAFDLANEGAGYLRADRLSVIVKRANTWTLLASNGVGRLEGRSEAVQNLQRLAEVAAHWGEPIEYAEGSHTDETPPAVAAALERHIDQSHARGLVAVPVSLGRGGELHTAAAVLIAENFGARGMLSRARVVELAELCEPALTQIASWDRWPIRPVMEWSDWWSRIWQSWGITRLTLAAAAAIAVVLALALVRIDFEVEAPATLMPQKVRDVFASHTGTIREINVSHGTQVEEGAVLAALDAPELELEIERVRGELETVRQRLQAINVTRTDRRSQDDVAPDRLPLSAEAQQLELRQASLVAQAKILEGERETLMVRSPLAGTVLTLDVQNLLRGRPVERGQVLFTVADADSGWRLEARVPQDSIGHIISAAQASDEPLSVRFRLAGDREHVYTGQVREIAATAVLNPEEVTDELPTVRVEVAVDDASLPAARPEMQARVRVNCGRRSLGYVWLHGAWNNIYSWLTF